MFKIKCFLFGLFLLGVNLLMAEESLVLDVIDYEALVQNDGESLQILSKALKTQGIVGVRGVPGYREAHEAFIQRAREWNALDEEIKEQYKPDWSLGLREGFLGYESGKEKFQRPNGEWVIDDLKTSYYAYVPDCEENKWPVEVDIKNPFEAIGEVMAEAGNLILSKIPSLHKMRISSQEEAVQVGRMLYYRKTTEDQNPFWCGAHFDHGLFTALLPSVYFAHGERIEEPEEAGLFVRLSKDTPFRKVNADLDLMLFQVGEFGQLATDDEILATEHRVHKALGEIERYTMAVFFDPPSDIPVYSQSVLTEDSRYGGNKGERCFFRDWSAASLERYLVR